MKAIGVGLAFAALLASGCTVSRSEYEILQQKLREDPALKQAAVSRCIEDWKAVSGQDKAQWAKFMKVSVKDTPRVYCARMFNAVAAGRIPYDDALTMDGGKTLSPKVVRIFR